MSKHEDAANDKRRPDEKVRPAATQNSGGGTEDRQEMGSAASSRRNPPHVTANDEGPIQDGRDGATGPTLPANAGGRDQFTAKEQDQGIDPESAYDRRSSQDKDSPPSER